MLFIQNQQPYARRDTCYLCALDADASWAIPEGEVDSHIIEIMHCLNDQESPPRLTGLVQLKAGDPQEPRTYLYPVSNVPRYARHTPLGRLIEIVQRTTGFQVCLAEDFAWTGDLWLVLDRERPTPLARAA